MCERAYFDYSRESILEQEFQEYFKVLGCYTGSGVELTYSLSAFPGINAIW
jgi:hypothetical protein